MHIKYLSIIGILLIGIAGSVWYTQSAEVPQQTSDIVSGYVTTTGPEGDLVEPAPKVVPLPPPPSSASELPSSHECERASLSISGKLYTPCATGVTVLELMRALSSEGLTFSGKEYTGLGYFVESINGTKAESGMYWSLYKNGTYSEFGAAQAKVAPGDQFEWRLEKSY